MALPACRERHASSRGLRQHHQPGLYEVIPGTKAGGRSEQIYQLAKELRRDLVSSSVGPDQDQVLRGAAGIGVRHSLIAECKGKAVGFPVSLCALPLEIDAS